MTSVDPSRAQFEAFKDLPRNTPIHMLNLVRLRDRAEYDPDHTLHTAGLSGRDAYAHYGKQSAPVLKRVGGHIHWRGRFETLLIGPENEAWDHVFIAAYPDAAAFLAMVTDPDYREAVKHRQAAVLTSRLIRTAPDAMGEAFA